MEINLRGRPYLSERPQSLRLIVWPDFVLFDLAPGTATFAEVVAVAKQLHAILDTEKVAAFVKTSGKSGLHGLAPWEQGGGYEEAQDWALHIAQQVVTDLPDTATMEQRKSKRQGKAYVDVLQNARGHHAVPSCVLCAVPQATVSTPLTWQELTPTLNPRQFTLKGSVAIAPNAGLAASMDQPALRAA